MLRLILALVSAAAAPPPITATDQARVVLYWAPWCAPCRAELHAYTELARAAAPMPLIVVALDVRPRDAPLLSPIPADRLILEKESSLEALARLAPKAAGLPYAAMHRAGGSICAGHNGILSVVVIEQMRRQCRSDTRPITPPPAIPRRGPDRPTPTG